MGPHHRGVGDVRTLVDTDSTDLNGAFYFQGDLPDGNDYVTVRAVRKNIGPSGHRHICKTGSLTITD